MAVMRTRAFMYAWAGLILSSPMRHKGLIWLSVKYLPGGDPWLGHIIHLENFLQKAFVGEHSYGRSSISIFCPADLTGWPPFTRAEKESSSETAGTFQCSSVSLGKDVRPGEWNRKWCVPSGILGFFLLMSLRDQEKTTGLVFNKNQHKGMSLLSIPLFLLLGH